MAHCIAALATRAGKASLCSVRISGDGAFSVAKKVFVPKNSKKDVERQPGYTALLGSFYRGGREIDSAVALFFRAPKSYTGEDVVEISCHGGYTAVDLLLKACYEAGAKPAEAGEFTKRAFLNGKMSLSRAEAVMEVVNATTARALTAAESALEGHLYRRVCAVRDDLLALVSHISAYTDYPEEAVEEVSDREVKEILTKTSRELSSLMEGYDSGRKIKNGVLTAIVGRPNVGKSTFLNGISGFEKAIVTPIAGTTRDVVEQEVTVGDIDLILQDTAGLRRTDDRVESIGIRRSVKSLERADLIFRVFDGSEPLCDEDRLLAEKCSDRRRIAVINKQDLPQKFCREEIAPFFKKVIRVTAKDFRPNADFDARVKEALGVLDEKENVGMLVNERQYRAVRDALAAVQEASTHFEEGFSLDIIGVFIDEALSAVYSLTGENVSEEVVNEVFSKFCVGK